MSGRAVLTNHAALAQCGGGIENPITNTRRSGTESHSFPVQRVHAYVQGAPFAVRPKAWTPNRVWGFHLWIRNRLKTGDGSSLEAMNTEPVIMIDGMRPPARAMRDDPAQLYTLCPDHRHAVPALSRAGALGLVAPLSPTARTGLLQRLTHARAVREGRAEWAALDANAAMLAWALMTISALEACDARDLGRVQ